MVPPIHDAAFRGAVATLRLLLESGESPDALDEFDRTPLHFLCRSVKDATRHHAACFKLLRDAGANLEASDSIGYRPLHCAVCGGSVELLSLLVQSGVNVDAATNHGVTALHVAARRVLSSAFDCIEVLLAAGASLDARMSQYGMSLRPFDMAVTRPYHRMWPLFLRAGAEIPTDNTEPYLVRVRNAGGFQRYAQAHVARIASILETPLLPPELVRKVLEFWLHAGYY